MPRPDDGLGREFRRHEIEIGAVTRDHRPLSGVIDEDRNRAGGMGFGFDQVCRHSFAFQILESQLSETISTDLADEAGGESGAAGPDRDVGGTPPGSQHHFAECVTAAQQFGVGADQHVPGEITEHAQRKDATVRRSVVPGVVGDSVGSGSHPVEGICETVSVPSNASSPTGADELPVEVDVESASSDGFGPTVLLALAAVWVIWGSTYLGIKIGLETMPPFFMQGCRFVLASGTMLVVLRMRGTPWPTRPQVRNACLVGILLLVGGLGMVTLAEDRGVDTGLVATIIAIQPMLMSLWGGLWRTWPRRIEWVGMLVGLGGVIVLMSDDGLSGSWNGIVLVFAACLSWSFGSALSRRIDMPQGFMATGIEMAAAAVVYMGISAVLTEDLDVPSARSVLALAYLVVFGSIVAFTAFTYLIGNVSGSLAMSYAYVNPAIAVLLGVVFSGEALSANMAVALPVILLGVAIVTNASRSAALDEVQPLGSEGAARGPS